MTKQTIINRALINLMDLKNKFSLTNNVSKTYIGVAVIIDTMCTLLLDEITTLTENSTQEELLDEINITIIKISQLKQ